MQEFQNSKLLKTLTCLDQDAAVHEMSDEATHRVIGKLPLRGQVVVINGLQFVVKSVNRKTGTMYIAIRKP